MKRRRRGAVRDQSDSAFSAILGRLCDDSGALAAALVDGEGETVDYAGLLSPYEIKVAAAEWRIVLAVVRESRLPGFHTVGCLTVRAKGRSFVIEAMPDGGKLIISSKLSGPELLVNFEDNGPGLADSERIFEPFFTTKAYGRGTGLGLALCRDFVERFGGVIHAGNRPQGGAVFVIRIPLKDQP